MSETESSGIMWCPHCGGDAALEQNYSYKTRSYFVYVKCLVCGSQGKICHSDGEPAAADWQNTACSVAVKAWNMRVNLTSKANKEKASKA